MTTETDPVQYFWTYSVEGEELFDGEFATKEEAVEYAQTRFNEQCSDGDDWKHDQEASIELVRFHIDDETGERVIHEKVEDTLEYEYYHGDLAEHGTWN